MPEPIDFSSIPEAAIKEMYRMAEIELEGTVQLALAADARATTFSGILGGGAVALLAGAASIIASDNYDKFHAVLWSALVVACAWFAGAIFCAWSSRPTKFNVGGYEPRKLVKSATEDAVWIIRYATEDLQRRLDENKITLLRNSHFLQWGLRASIPLHEWRNAFNQRFIWLRARRRV